MQLDNLPPLPIPAATPEPVSVEGRSVIELAKEMAPLAMQQLYEIGSDPEVKPAARVSALNAIIERAEGKVGIADAGTTNYTVIINQINRVRGKQLPAAIDVTPDAAE